MFSEELINFSNFYLYTKRKLQKQHTAALPIYYIQSSDDIKNTLKMLIFISLLRILDNLIFDDKEKEDIGNTKELNEKFIEFINLNTDNKGIKDIFNILKLLVDSKS